jgi:short-subunit dehydrogenase
LLHYCSTVPGGIDVLINNAGISEFSPLEELSDTRLQELLGTNLLAPMQVTRTLLPLLRRQSSAAIVNVGSTFGSIGYAGFSAYCASKFGLRGFTEALRRELADSAVAVLYLAPRATRTAINEPAVDDLNQALGNATDDPLRVGAALVELLESERSNRFIGWPEKLFVAINQIAPALIDRALRKQLGIIKSFFNAHEKGA